MAKCQRDMLSHDQEKPRQPGAVTGQRYKWIQTDEALHTVFLPIRAPSGHYACSCKKYFNETGALEDFADICSDLLPPNMQRMLAVWNDTYRLDKDSIAQCLRQCQPGHTIPVHLLAQNTALTFTREGLGMFMIRGYKVQPTMASLSTAFIPLYTSTPNASLLLPEDVATSSELAMQLEAMQRTEFIKTDYTHEAKSPTYVFDWLLPALDAMSPFACAHDDAIALRKKLRDHCTGDDDFDTDDCPTRRHPGWLALKLVLHTELACAQGERIGTLLYKAAMLRFMTEFLQHGNHLSDHSLAKQMLAKISYRIRKLEAFLDKEKESDDTREEYNKVRSVLKNATRQVQQISQDLTSDWNRTVDLLEGCREGVPPLQHPSDADIELPVGEACKSLIRLFERRNEEKDLARKNTCKSTRATKDNLASIAMYDHLFGDEDKLAGLHDFEKSILEMWRTQRSDEPSASVASVASEYLLEYSKAIENVPLSNDPIGRSRATLTGAILTALVDMNIASKYPLLAEHVTDIDPEPWSKILATDRDQLEILQQVQAYFSKRNQAAVYETGPLENGVSPDSISVRFAECQQQMLDNLSKLLDEELVQRRVHEQSVEVAINDMREQERLLATMECDYYYYDAESFYATSPRKVHSLNCKKCAKETEMDGKTFHVFQENLPRKRSKQLAVVFEAGLPLAISVWRDTIYGFLKLLLHFLDKTNDNSASSMEMLVTSSVKYTPWRERISSTGVFATVGLGFPTAARKAEKEKLRRNMSVSSFIKESPHDFTLCENTQAAKLTKIQPTDYQCAWSLNLTNNEVLQCFLPSCTHQQNKAIAWQARCLESFSPQEFVAFGSLRAGDRLQWFNILRGIHQRTLVLHSADVVQLLCQAVWEAGSADTCNDCDGCDDNCSLQYAHAPCRDKKFVVDLVRELNGVMDATAENWQHHWTLTAVVVLANRLYDIYRSNDEEGPTCEAVIGLCCLLARCRTQACEWLAVVDDLIQNSTTMERKALNKVKRVCRPIALSGLLTYRHCARLPCSEYKLSPLVQWMKLMVCLRNATVSSTNAADPLFESLLHNLVRRTTCDVHDELAEMVQGGFTVSMNGDCVHKELDVFVAASYVPGTCSDYQIETEGRFWITMNWLTLSGGTELVEINLHQGDFHIRGQPKRYLPVGISEHILFKRHFSSTPRTVQPSTGYRGEDGYVSQHKAGDGRFIFCHPRANDEVYIKDDLGSCDSSSLSDDEYVILTDDDEVHWICTSSSSSSDGDDDELALRKANCTSSSSSSDGDDDELALRKANSLPVYEVRGDRWFQLIPCEWFQSSRPVQIPRSILDNHSLWFECASHQVYFRPLSVLDPEFGAVEKAKYVLDIKSLKLRVTEYGPADLPAGSCLVSHLSSPGRAIVTALSVLEMRASIEVWLDRKTGDVHTRLPRFNLSFTLPAAESTLISLDHKGWFVDANQSFGTLIGFKDGLVLAKRRHDGTIDQRCVLIPHGQLEVSDVDVNHRSVCVNRYQLHQPPLFRYDLDSKLKQLSGPFSRDAWVFLASLHAHTASVHPDPFTSLTGMESAMDILHSARCWTTEEYTFASLQSLRGIADLSPKRVFCKGHRKLVEVVKWPLHMPDLCAPDAYQLLKHEMVQFSKQLGFLHGKDEEISSKANRLHPSVTSTPPERSPRIWLAQRAENENRRCYPLKARMSKQTFRRNHRQIPAFSFTPTPASRVAHVASAVTLRPGKLQHYSPDEIEKALLRSSSGETMDFSDDVDDDELSSCGYWATLTAGEHFLALHQHINSVKDSVSGRIHLGLLLSFLTFHKSQQQQLQDSIEALHQSHNDILLDTLVSLCHASLPCDTPVCRSYPTSAPPGLPSVEELIVMRMALTLDNELARKLPTDTLCGFPSAETLVERFMTPISTYMAERGVKNYDGCQYERDASESDQCVSHELGEGYVADITAEYCHEKTFNLAAVDKDLQAALKKLREMVQAVSSPYDAPSFTGPGSWCPYQSEECSLFQYEEFKSFMLSQLEYLQKQYGKGLHPSSILSLYVKDIDTSTSGIGLLPSSLPALEPGPDPRDTRHVPVAPLPLSYSCCGEDNGIWQKLKGLWCTPAVAEAEVHEEIFEGCESGNRGLQQLQEILSTGKGSDPVMKSFSTDLARSVEALINVVSDSAEKSLATEIVKKGIVNTGQKRRQFTQLAWQMIEQLMMLCVSNSLGTQALAACDLTLRCHPRCLFPLVLANGSCVAGDSDEEVQFGLKDVIGGLLVSEVLDQRLQRMLRLIHSGQEEKFKAEYRNVPHTTWRPCDHPEWLVFELENDLCIRSKQIEVAKQMMNPPRGQNAVMQLNMGEGKTSIIMPITAAELADGETLVRLIVLAPQFKTNYNQLVFKLGGLLNRRILTLPFQRSVKLVPERVSRIHNQVTMCRQSRGILVSVREHVLSMQLKRLEACRQNYDTEMVKELNGLVDDVCRNVRDIIDEADEVLHHRFQLVYPIGRRRSPDGKDMRWQMMESVFECVRTQANELQVLFPSAVSFVAKGRHQFPVVRFLGSKDEDAAYVWLTKKIVSNVFSGRGPQLVGMNSELMDDLSGLSKENRQKLKQFLLSKELRRSQVQWFKGEIPERAQKAMLCLRGVLASGVLLLALQKRYRVDYGLLMTTSSYLPDSSLQCCMAVPFRAKDVAADRTEFGHTDVAIALTLLSYYQQGLSKKQIDTMLDRLEKKSSSSRNAIYSAWVERAETVHDSVREFSGINRRNTTVMENHVYPFLKFHTGTINFYLNELVFPIYSREFPEKLLSNAWVLVPGSRQKPITGFSGTNDTKLLLPNSISQQDLTGLQHTNAHVCRLVLSTPDNMYRVLPAQCTGTDLLGGLLQANRDETIGNVQINTLIDAGAVILDLTNSEVAEAWLSVRTDKQAVVYFDKDQLLVMRRQSNCPVKLEISPYASDLGDCLVYLDHSHTRGTDLPITMGTQAAVTLGKGLQRDELVQACMRMRRLGAGHTLSFWAPPEVDRSIKQQCGLEDNSPVQHLHILQWCFLNTVDATKSGFYAWATQGLAFLHMRKAEMMFKRDSKSGHEEGDPAVDKSLITFGRKSCLPDAMTLEKMYGSARDQRCVSEIVADLGHKLEVEDTEELVKACQVFIPNMLRYSHKLDEEQEREMELETNVTKKIEKRLDIVHAEESCPDYLKRLVVDADVSCLEVGPHCRDPIPLWHCLKKTYLATHDRVLASRAWNHSTLLATQSFACVVSNEFLNRESQSSIKNINGELYVDSKLYGLQRLKEDPAPKQAAKRNNHVRPVEWLLVVRGASSPRVIAICPYEANCLLSIRHWSPKVSLHLYASVIHPEQHVMSDWSTTVRGPRLPHIRTAAEKIRSMFAELLCFSGGLFFGPTADDRQSTMVDLSKLLDLAPSPDRVTSGVPVRWRGTAHHVRGGVGFQDDPCLLIRELLLLHRCSESIDVSHMGMLLQQHSWVDSNISVVPQTDDIEM